MKRKEGPHIASMLVLWAFTVSASFGLTQYRVRMWMISTLTPAAWTLKLASGSQSGIVLHEPWIEPFKQIRVSYKENDLPDGETSSEEEVQPRTDIRLEELRQLLHQTDMIHMSGQAVDISPPVSTEYTPEDGVMRESSPDETSVQQAVN